MIFDDGSLEQCRALLLRWNKAAAAAGTIGSEFIDDPERVFLHLAERKRFEERLAYRRGQMGLGMPEDGVTCLMTDLTIGQAVMELDSRRELRRTSWEQDHHTLRKSSDGRMVTHKNGDTGFYRPGRDDRQAMDWEVWTV